jgi:hypothetical protein
VSRIASRLIPRCLPSWALEAAFSPLGGERIREVEWGLIRRVLMDSVDPIRLLLGFRSIPGGGFRCFFNLFSSKIFWGILICAGFTKGGSDLVELIFLLIFRI